MRYKGKKITLSNVLDKLLGEFRYILYYKYPRFMRKHIKQQVEARINSMNYDCYMNGSCKECGCNTTALQMIKRSCEAYCYPKFVSKRKWKKIYREGYHLVYQHNAGSWYYNFNEKMFAEEKTDGQVDQDKLTASYKWQENLRQYKTIIWKP